MYDVKYCCSDTLQEPVLLKPTRQIRVSHTTFKVMDFVDFTHMSNSLMHWAFI